MKSQDRSLREFVVARSAAGYGIRSRQMGPGRTARAINVRSRPHSNRSATVAAWLVLFGLIIPTAELYPKITPGRIGIYLLLIPALIMLRQRGRRLVMSDLFVCATAGWMTVALVYNIGLDSLTKSGAAEALDLFGGYTVARAFFLGSTALDAFIRVLKVFATAAIILGMADTMTGHLFIHNIFASIMGYPAPGVQFREGMLRAMSTFDHAILFGAFCATAAVIFLYSERSALRRAFWFGFGSFGCILSYTSAALMSVSISLAAYTYERLLRQHRWRWTAFWILLTAMIIPVYFISENPIRWVILHLTLEPQHGYYRLMIWDNATVAIPQSPWFGTAFKPLNNPILDSSIDCVWLVMGLRYGIPAIVFLFLANVTAFFPAHESFNSQTGDPYMKRMRTGFTMALIMLMFMGLTVHYWSYMWIFWGLCIGIRASLREQSIVAAANP